MATLEGQAYRESADLGVLEAAGLLRSRELSAAELLASCLRRIDEAKREPAHL